MTGLVLGRTTTRIAGDGDDMLGSERQTNGYARFLMGVAEDETGASSRWTRRIAIVNLRN